MPSIRYMNQSAPFWDFIASLEQQGTEHPLFGNRTRGGESSDEEGAWGWGPWGWPGAGRGWPQGPSPYAGPHGHPHPPPPPPPHHDDAAPQPPTEHGDGPSPPAGPPDEHADPPESVPGSHPPHHDGPEHGGRGRHGRHGHERRGNCGRGRGGFRGPWGRRGMGPFNMSALADFIQSQMWDGDSNSNSTNNNNPGEDVATQAQDFKPEADVFDTEAAFVVHFSLPGAKKEDTAVNWDADKSELSVAGVIHRPGDEEFLKTLALDERKIGAFERKIRLGSRASPAQVDVDGISARFEDGILIVNVPKEDKDFVEVRKVDIE